MSQITLQLLEGIDRGREYRDLSTPVSIGREEENTIRLNDERVSRFHAKIQEDQGRIILTDLESTNGTRVNGHPIHMRVLQVGDEMSIGRCLLIFGSRDEIAERARQLTADRPQPSGTDAPTVAGTLAGDPADDEGTLHANNQKPPVQDMPSELFPKGPPTLPDQMSPLQRAELSDFLSYLHEQLRLAITSCMESEPESSEGIGEMRIAWPDWQRILQVEMELAVGLRKLADPDAD